MPIKLNFKRQGFIITLDKPVVASTTIYRSPHEQGALDWGNEQTITNDEAITLIQKDIESLRN